MLAPILSHPWKEKPTKIKAITETEHLNGRSWGSSRESGTRWIKNRAPFESAPNSMLRQKKIKLILRSLKKKSIASHGTCLTCQAKIQR